MLRFLKNISIVLLLVLLGYSPVFYFNVYEDPYSIFTSDFSNIRIEPNSHFIKMRYLAGNKTRFDSFIFGNSRANNVNPALFRNGTYYNAYYSLGLPYEYFRDITLLLKNEVEIKNIVVFLDFTSYTTDTMSRRHDMLRVPYTRDKIPLLKRYINYSFQVPDEKFKKEYFNSKSSSVYAKMFETGQAENKEADLFIENNRLAHINDPKFTVPHLGYANNVDATIADMASIKKLCDENKIKLTIVMNPIHKTTYLANNHNLYSSFLKKLSAVSDFYDFSGINRVTTNNYFYYETSHFRPIIGDAMVRFIQDQKSIDTIPEFGRYVSKQNIDEHLSLLKSQL